MTQMSEVLKKVTAQEEKRKEFQETIDEFNRIQAEVEATTRARMDKETVERLVRESKEMEGKIKLVK